MSEDQDDASKTEEPTDKRKEKAREEGNVPVSQEIKSLMMLAGGVIALAFFAPKVASDIKHTLRPLLARPDSIPTDFESLRALVAGILADIGLSLLFPVSILIVLAVLSVVGQVGFVYSPKRLAPKLDKLNIIQGLKQFLGPKKFIELFKSVFKLILIGVALSIIVFPNLEWILRLPEMETEAMLLEVRYVLLLLVMTITSVMIAIAATDAAIVRYQNYKKLKMTKQEVKDEHKQAEGDPQVKARIRALRAERARQRMMSAVPEADVVVTNPTHYAVALSYKIEDMSAPKVVAKGADLVAMRIRELATENEVPIVENPPLARALYATVEIDEFIPPEHYKPVAEVISYVMGLKKK